MKKALLIFLGIFLLAVFILLGLRLLSGEDNWICDKGEWVKHGKPSGPKPSTLCPGTRVQKEIPTPTSVQPTEIKETEKGTIEGSLSFPSEGIPEDLLVCAENLETKVQICTIDHIKDSQYTYGEGYKIEVPPGNYYVFASLPNNKDNKAYYSEFVTCGLSVDCKSHEPILVTVKEGETASEIDPQDWYK